MSEKNKTADEIDIIEFKLPEFNSETNFSLLGSFIDAYLGKNKEYSLIIADKKKDQGK